MPIKTQNLQAFSFTSSIIIFRFIRLARMSTETADAKRVAVVVVVVVAVVVVALD